MDPSDSRHGTPAGYRAHYRAKKPYCDPCRQAWRDHKAKNAPAPDDRPTTRAGRALANGNGNYAKAGYSPADGLGEGQWVTVPNSGGLLKWVGEKDSDIEEPPRGRGRRRTKACADCGDTISRQALRCRPCSLERVRLTNRRYMAYQRSQDAA